MVALFVVVFVLLLLAIDLVIQTRQKKYPLISRAVEPSLATRSDVVRMPKDLFFHPGHMWVRLQSGSQVSIGMDDFIQKIIGKIERVVLPEPGTFVKQGQPIAQVQHNGRNLSLIAPVTGHVRSINRDLLDNPALIGENPYEAGWLLQIEPVELAANLGPLSLAEHAVSWIKKEAVRFRDFMTSHSLQPALVGETMMDGGIPVSNSLDHLDESSVTAFEEAFLNRSL